jgi:hypothetical protein
VSDQVVNAADRLSAMADKVAGFAISSNLLLTFACLKDISLWVHNKTGPFLIGTGVAGCVYVAAVWWLYSRELHVRAKAQPSDDLSLLNSVSRSLVWALSLGIAAFTAIGMLAVAGASSGPGP